MPKLLDALKEDNGLDPETYIPDLNSIYAIALLSGESNEQLHGFVLGRHYTDTIVETHVAIDPAYWGRPENVQLGKEACTLLFAESGAKKLVASIPIEDKQVLRFAQRVGFKREGLNRRSFLRNGELLDQYYVGMTKP